MKCPVCKHHQAHTQIEVHANGFDEDLFQCDICGSTWSVNHGLAEVVRDTQRSSFLAANSDPVDGADNS
ncbi:MAG: hypothetical protein OEL80_02580 [Desulfuromonadales bacterium]|nr:hypothetical protein [Desulfuromonadales bacterium]